MWSYGTNLLDLNYIKSDANNPLFDQMGPALAVVERFATGQDAGRLHSCLTAEGSSSAFTKTEVRTDGRLSLDASKLWFKKPGIWDVYVLYRYWYNKFGTDRNAVLLSEIAPG